MGSKIRMRNKESRGLEGAGYGERKETRREGGMEGGEKGEDNLDMGKREQDEEGEKEDDEEAEEDRQIKRRRGRVRNERGGGGEVERSMGRRMGSRNRISKKEMRGGGY